MKKQIVCLTPVKNEAWILDKFLTAAGLWADHIIVVDHCSTDSSRDIAARHPKVRIVDYASASFDEVRIRTLLLQQARAIDGEKILIALDADEFLSANVLSSAEWQQLHALPPGTAIKLKRINVRPGVTRYWLADTMWFGFVDDNCSEQPQQVIHGPRLPLIPGSRRPEFHDVVVMHMAYLDWDRMESRHRWYQCWERINRDLRPVFMYRKYHHMNAVGRDRLLPIPPEWLAGYAAVGVDLTHVERTGDYWWDRATLAFFRTFGAARFRRDAVWDIDWVGRARRLGLDDPGDYADPRHLIDRAVHLWLALSQPFSVHLRQIDRVLNWLYRGRGTP